MDTATVDTAGNEIVDAMTCAPGRVGVDAAWPAEAMEVFHHDLSALSTDLLVLTRAARAAMDPRRVHAGYPQQDEAARGSGRQPSRLLPVVRQVPTAEVPLL